MGEKKYLEKCKGLFRISKAPISNYSIMILLTCMMACANTIVSYLTQEGIDSANNKNDNIKYTCMMMISFIVVYGIAFYLLNIYKEKFKQKLSKNLKSNILRGTMNFSHEVLNKYSTGDFVVRIMDDCDICSEYIVNIIFPTIQMLLTIVVGWVYIFRFSWLIGCMAIVIIPIFYYLNKQTLEELVEEYEQIKQKEEGITTLFQEIYDNFPVVKVFKMTNKLVKKYSQYFNEKYEEEVKTQVLRSKMKYLTETQLWIMEILCVLLGILLYKNGSLTVGALIGISNAFLGSIVYSVIDLPNIVSALSNQFGAWDRIVKFLDWEEENLGIEAKIAYDNQKDICLSIKDLTFLFDERNVFQDVNMDIKKGEIVFLKGESGQGKTTLIKNILGILKANHGDISIKIGDQVIQENRNNYIAYVPQKNLLLPISIKENLTLGKNVEDSKIKEVLKVTNLDNKIYGEGIGLERIVDEEVKFSGGEMQRILIARALLHNTPILIFDEPFSALDRENIRLILNILKKIKSEKIIMIISHQSDGMELANKVYQMEEGRVVLYERK